MTRRILVAVDQSEGSRRAAEFVDQFFEGEDIDITAVNVARTPIDTPPAIPFGGVFAWHRPLPREFSGDALNDEVMKREDEAERIAARQAPSDADVEVRLGDPVSAISRAAEDQDADLIVVGSNDKGFLERLVSGSVSEDLDRTAPRPVLIVR